MRAHALSATAVLVTAVLALAPAAPAAAGGTPAPQRSGGTAYGAAIDGPDKRPVARRLSLSPRQITAGDAAPRIRFRVRQRGVRRVSARVVVLRLPGNRPVARVKLGWVRTGRRVDVRLPKGTRLRAGHYLVRLHVKDGRGHTLRRSRAYPGRARIVVRGRPQPPPPAVPAPAPLPSPLPAPGTPGAGVFPVAGAFDFGGADARFGAGRRGHTHEGQDIMAAQGTPVVAPVPGRVGATDYQGSGAGEYVVVDGADGRGYFFAHCVRGSTAVAEGAPVAAGRQLCRVGASGTTSGAPHLHFEIWVGGWRAAGGSPIDPLPELRAWAGR